MRTCKRRKLAAERYCMLNILVQVLEEAQRGGLKIMFLLRKRDIYKIRENEKLSNWKIYLTVTRKHLLKQRDFVNIFEVSFNSLRSLF